MLNCFISTNKDSTRKGRGHSSGKGKTSGRGHKGQKARSGVAIKNFEGGQTKITMRLPKRGFNSLNDRAKVIKLSQIKNISKLIKSDKIMIDVLIDQGIISNKDTIKILSDMTKESFNIKVNIEGISCSKSAAAVIEACGGAVN